jgi:hypothetical protein
MFSSILTFAMVHVFVFHTEACYFVVLVGCYQAYAFAQRLALYAPVVDDKQASTPILIA